MPVRFRTVSFLLNLISELSRFSCIHFSCGTVQRFHIQYGLPVCLIFYIWIQSFSISYIYIFILFIYISGLIFQTDHLSAFSTTGQLEIPYIEQPAFCSICQNRDSDSDRFKSFLSVNRKKQGSFKQRKKSPLQVIFTRIKPFCLLLFFC